VPVAFTPRRILVAVDFSEPSRTALRFGARLAVQCSAELHVLHAEDPLLSAAARAGGIDLRDETLEELPRFIDASALPPGAWSASPTAAGDRTARIHVVGGHARQVICDIATRERADAIVVGARGMSGTEHLIFGSTTEGVLRLAAVPVIVVPHTWSPPAPASPDLTGAGPVIAAVDFGESSIESASAAARLAQTLNTALELAHVVPPLPVIERWAVHAQTSRSDRVERARGDLAQLGSRLNAHEPLNLHVHVGPVPACLAEIARPRDNRHPILFLGRRRAEDRGLPPGAIAYRVLTLAQVPVVVYLSE
jgi:nucleotide-binding universal stress UspA family protein